MELINTVQTIIANLYAFYQPRFAKSIGYHAAHLNILKHIAWGIII